MELFTILVVGIANLIFVGFLVALSVYEVLRRRRQTKAIQAAARLRADGLLGTGVRGDRGTRLTERAALYDADGTFVRDEVVRVRDVGASVNLPPPVIRDRATKQLYRVQGKDTEKRWKYLREVA